MARKVSPAKAAKILGVHRNTVYSWCHSAMHGNVTPLGEVWQNPRSKHIKIDSEVVRKIKGN